MIASAPFTVDARPEAEAQVAADLERVTEEVRREAEGDGLLAVFLLGGFARGEGVVVTGPDGALHGFNDYDLLLVFDRPPARAGRYSALSRRLAAELGIDFVDLGMATPADLEAAGPTLFWYELGEAHRVLWAREGARVELPRFRLESIDPAEGSRLLLNRGMAHLWGALRLWPGGPGEDPPSADAGVLRFAAIAAHKAVLAAGDAALLRSRAYSTRQRARLEILRTRPELRSWAARDFLDAYAAAAAFRREPRVPGPAETAALWWTARDHHRDGFRAAEEVRLGAPLGDWASYPGRIRARAGRERMSRPREAFRSLRRAAHRESWLRNEERFFISLPGLLYAPGSGRPRGAEASAWRERAETLIREWHP